MYATLSYDLADTFICEIENTADYLALVRKLRKVGNDLDGERRTAALDELHRDAGVRRADVHLDSEGAAAGEFATRRAWRAGGGIHLNPEGYVGGSIERDLADRYGPTRVISGGTATRRNVWRCGRGAADVRVQYITDPPPGLPSAITQAEGACFPTGDYNLGFAEKITRLQFGVTLQREQFLSFRIKPI